MPNPRGDTFSRITAELRRFVKAGRLGWRLAGLETTWLCALPAVQKQIAALELEADPSSNELMDAIEAAIESALDELPDPISSAGLDYFGFSDSGRQPLGKTEREERAAARLGKSGRWFRDRNSNPLFEGQSPASWTVGEVAKRLLAEDRPERPDGGRAGYARAVPRSFEPLVAYLRGLHGPASKKWEAIDAARVEAFGFPEPWPGDDGSLPDSDRAALVIADLRRAIEEVDRRNGEFLFHHFFGKGLESESQDAASEAAAAKLRTPRNFERKALLELAQRLYSQVEIDTRAKREGAATPMAGDVAECIVRDLESLYKPDGLDRLARMIVSDAPVYDAVVTLTLCDNEDDANSYLLTQFIEGVCRRSAYYLAISARATLTDLIKSTCDQVSGFFTCSEQDQVMERAKAWENDESALTLLSSDDKELGKQDPLCLHIVDDDAERSEVLAGVDRKVRQDVSLLRADIPRAATDRPSRVSLRLTSPMARADHYCSWVAERPTFLKKMTFDASGMKLDKDERFTLQPCFRGPATEPKKPRDNFYEIFVNGWIVRGQGASLVWG